MRVRYGFGGYVQAEKWVLLRPRRTIARPLIIALHGAGGEERFAHYPYPEIRAFFRELVEAGFVVLSIDAEDGLAANPEPGAHTWGNDGSTSTVDAAITYAQATFAVDDGPVGLLATSMGALVALNTWRRFPARIGGVVAVSGAVDLEYHATGDDPATGKYQTEAEGAYGGAGGLAAAMATHNPAAFVPAAPAGDYAPLVMYHAEDDAVAPIENVEALAAVRPVDLRTVPTGGHTAAVWPQIDAGEVAADFRAMAG